MGAVTFLEAALLIRAAVKVIICGSSDILRCAAWRVTKRRSAEKSQTKERAALYACTAVVRGVIYLRKYREFRTKTGFRRVCRERSSGTRGGSAV